MPEKKTYKAMQVTGPGVLEMVERDTPTPAIGEVLIQVEACGICGADAGVIEGREAGLQYPRVPGHEVVGRIVATGPGTASIWRVGQRVGVGRLGGHCNECEQCPTRAIPALQEPAHCGEHTRRRLCGNDAGPQCRAGLDPRHT